MENNRTLNEQEKMFCTYMNFTDCNIRPAEDTEHGFIIVDEQGCFFHAAEPCSRASEIITYTDILLDDYFFSALIENAEEMGIECGAVDSCEEWAKFAAEHSDFYKACEWDCDVMKFIAECAEHDSEIDLQKCYEYMNGITA